MAHGPQIERCANGYYKFQIRAQLYLAHRMCWVGPEPPHGTELYLSNLPTSATLEDILKLVQTYGTVFMIRLPIKETLEGKGYAYVRFVSKADADLALTGLHGTFLGGKFIRAEVSRDCRTLQIDNWPPQLSGPDSLRILQSALGKQVISATVFEDFKSNKPNMGFVLATFVSHNAAAIARRSIKDNILQSFTNYIHGVTWIRGDHEIPEDKYLQVKELYVGGLPAGTARHELAEAIRPFLKFGVNFIPKVNVGGFGFLYFDNHAEAEEAFLRLRRSDIRVRDSKISVSWVKGEYLKKKQDIHSPTFMRTHEALFSEPPNVLGIQNFGPAIMQRTYPNIYRQVENNPMFAANQQKFVVESHQAPNCNLRSFGLMEKVANNNEARSDDDSSIYLQRAPSSASEGNIGFNLRNVSTMDNAWSTNILRSSRNSPVFMSNRATLNDGPLSRSFPLETPGLLENLPSTRILDNSTRPLPSDQVNRRLSTVGNFGPIERPTSKCEFRTQGSSGIDEVGARPNDLTVNWYRQLLQANQHSEIRTKESQDSGFQSQSNNTFFDSQWPPNNPQGDN